MTYQVLARKWRPKDFCSLAGQEHVVRALTHALAQQRLHHAYLFTGTRGIGKTTLSRILAKALNCETGITATPCGVCKACQEIDAGRFIDYLEIDAASNRGVDEMASLLERAVYAPVDARFKIYMIDEVHMLSSHAFNAMLKTLEEPPPHVKFILATTDPQKIPVTVLSRCLQFNLKRMPTAQIVSQLERVLSAEQIVFEPQALQLLARAADGSMRDALSLTEQAIAYAAGNLGADAVQRMLGTSDQRYLIDLLDAVAAHDGAAVLALADEITAHSLSFSTILQDLSLLLHRIAWAQFVPTSVLDEWPEADDVRRLAGALSAETVQLYYQIVTIGCSELGLAPDPYAGFTMTLLRLLAFRAAVDETAPHITSPCNTGGRSPSMNPMPQPAQADAADPYPTTVERPMPPSAVRASLSIDTDWPALVSQLPLRGLAKELAFQSELVDVEGTTLSLRVPVAQLAERAQVDKLKSALRAHLGQPVELVVATGEAACTAAAAAKAQRMQRQQQAEQAIHQDQFVQSLLREFDATIMPGSIRPAPSATRPLQSDTQPLNTKEKAS